ncbi:hypothetical protein ACFLTE_10100 [Bacteroidota bacterium]
MKIKLVIIFCYFLSFVVDAQHNLTSNCINARKELFSFNFQNAYDNINIEKKINPNNLSAYYIENYIDLIETVIDGSEERLEVYKNNFYDRIDVIKSISDKSDPYYLLYLSEMYLQTTLLNGQFKEFINAGYHFYKSYKYTEENIELFPDFIFNKKTKGIHDLLISIIPEEYESLFSFLGFKGGYEQGKQNIDEYYNFAKNKESLNNEAVMFKFFVLAQFGKDELAPLEFLNNEKYDTSSNIVVNLCYVLAIKQTGNTDKVIDFIEKKEINPDNYPIPHLNYLIGSLKFTRLDDNSNIYFEKFLKYYKGGHFIKHTNRKLAWYYYLHDNIEKYNYHKSKAIKEGLGIIEHDRQAFYELSDTVQPNKTLIKARLLFDGGYHLKAKKLLIENAEEFKKTNLKNQVEYFYRLARVYQVLKDFDKAKKYFNYTLQYGESIKQYYFVPNAAYNLGLIKEVEGNYEEAKQLYKKCLSTIKRSYYISIDRKAKMALKRVDEIIKNQ